MKKVPGNHKHSGPSQRSDPRPKQIDLIVEIQQGSKEAFKEFFYDYYPVLCAFAERFLIDQDKSKDVAQEAFIKFWERKHEFNTLNHVKGFLYTVVKNSSINTLKKASRNEQLIGLNDLEAESFFKKNIIEKETYLMLRKSIEALPERMKQIIEYSLSGLKNHEIAEKMEISTNTVHTAKKNAYKKIREMIKRVYFMFLV
jgi:RNA polymerase sigma-70 factor (family 1)